MLERSHNCYADYYIPDSLKHAKDYMAFRDEYFSDLKVSDVDLTSQVYQYPEELFNALAIIYTRLQRKLTEGGEIQEGPPIDISVQNYKRSPREQLTAPSVDESVPKKVVEPALPTNVKVPSGPASADDKPVPADIRSSAPESPKPPNFAAIFGAIDVSSFNEEEKSKLQVLKECLEDSAKTLKPEIQELFVPFIADDDSPKLDDLFRAISSIRRLIFQK